MALLERTDARLIVLGARGQYRDELRSLATRCGVADRVDLPGFVDDGAYRQVMARSSVVVLNSSDEGFGLPVVEAEHFGIPVVTAADSGLDAIHPGRVAVAAPDPSSLATAIDVALSRPARRFPPRPTWAETARGIRRLIEAAQPVERTPVPVAGGAS
jgi:glycosyltransferase involved in cell wall biosynthesis